MAFIFCPKCGARIKWTRSCSECGAEIALYDALDTRKDDVESPRHDGDAQAKQGIGQWRPNLPWSLLVLAVAVGAIGAIVLGALWVGNGSRSTDIQPPAFVETVSEYAYYADGATIMGADGEPIVLLNNKEARDVSWRELKRFLRDDETDRIPFVNGVFACGEFAETLHNNAERAGIKAAFVAVFFSGADTGHAANAFNTTDTGIVYIDDTGCATGYTSSADRKVVLEVGRRYEPESIFPSSRFSCSGSNIVYEGTYWESFGTVSDFTLTW